jgi:acetyl-CoA C-acetyltransferase
VHAGAAIAPIDFPPLPSVSLPLAIKKAGLEIKDIARFEINEAFSAVIRAIEKILGLDPAKVNPNGYVSRAFTFLLPRCRVYSSFL